METRLQCMRACLLAGLFVCVVGAPTYSQPPNPSDAALRASQPGTQPQVIHYHFHQHYYLAPWNASAPAWSSPSSGSYGARPGAPGNGPSYGADTSFPGIDFTYGPFGMVPVPNHAPLPMSNTAAGVPTAQAVIHVFLPTADAVVYLNGHKMRGTGKDRRIATGPLPPGRE